MAILYQHRRNDTNEIFYIGIGSKIGRAHASFSKRNKHWGRVVKKYGFTVEILSDNLCWEQCKQIEIMLISKYGRKDKGEGELVNQTDGGDGQENPSKETRKKMSIARKKRVTKQSTRDKISKAMKGNNNGGGKKGYRKN